MLREEIAEENQKNFFNTSFWCLTCDTNPDFTTTATSHSANILLNKSDYNVESDYFPNHANEHWYIRGNCKADELVNRGTTIEWSSTDG